MTNKYKNRKNAVVNPPFEGNHCKTFEQRIKRHNRNVCRREMLPFLGAYKNGKTHADMKGGATNAN